MKVLLTTLKALSDKTRLRIVNLLMEDELCICQIQAVLNMSQPRISRHIRILKEAGLLKSRKEAQMTFYSIVMKSDKVILDALNENMKNDKLFRKERKIGIKIPLCRGQ